MKSLIVWLEQDKARTRKFILVLTVFSYILVTVALFSCALGGVEMTSQIVNLFTIFTGLMATVYGFFTGTSSDKTKEVADKAADIMLKKMNDLESSAKPETSKPESFD